MHTAWLTQCTQSNAAACQVAHCKVSWHYMPCCSVNTDNVLVTVGPTCVLSEELRRVLHQELSSTGEVAKQVGVGVPQMLIAKPRLKGCLNAQVKQPLQRQVNQYRVHHCLSRLSRKYQCLVFGRLSDT